MFIYSVRTPLSALCLEEKKFECFNLEIALSHWTICSHQSVMNDIHFLMWASFHLFHAATFKRKLHGFIWYSFCILQVQSLTSNSRKIFYGVPKLRLSWQSTSSIFLLHSITFDRYHYTLLIVISDKRKCNTIILYKQYTTYTRLQLEHACGTRLTL